MRYILAFRFLASDVLTSYNFAIAFFYININILWFFLSLFNVICFNLGFSFTDGHAKYQIPFFLGFGMDLEHDY